MGTQRLVEWKKIMTHQYRICHFPSLCISSPDDPKSRQFTESTQNTHCYDVSPNGSSCVAMRFDNAIVDTIKLILLIYNNSSIVKKIVNKIERVN